MRKNIIVSAAIVSALALAGCSSTATNEPTATTPAADESVTTAPATTPAAEAMSADSLAAKLTAAGFTFTTKDRTEGAKALKNGAAIAKSTEFKVTVPNETVILTVNELSDPTQKVAVESDIRMSWIPVVEDGTMKAVMAKLNSDSVLVGVIYKVAVEKDAWKVMDAIGAQ